MTANAWGDVPHDDEDIAAGRFGRRCSFSSLNPRQTPDLSALRGDPITGPISGPMGSAIADLVRAVATLAARTILISQRLNRRRAILQMSSPGKILRPIAAAALPLRRRIDVRHAAPNISSSSTSDGRSMARRDGTWPVTSIIPVGRMQNQSDEGVGS